MEKVTDWDPSEHLESKEQMAHYLEAALDDGDCIEGDERFGVKTHGCTIRH